MIINRFRSSQNLILVLVCLFSFKSNAQDVETLIAKYPDKNGCNIRLHYHYNIVIKNNEPVVTFNVIEERMFLSDKVSSALKESVHFSSFFNLAGLNAASYTPNGKGYSKNKVSEFSVSSSNSGGIFYDDSKEQTFYFKGITKGAKTLLDYTLNIKLPHLMTPVRMQDFYPSEEIMLTITFPTGVELGYTMTNLTSDDVEFTTTTKGKNTTYTWIRKNIKEAKYESDGPHPHYYLPLIHPYIISTTTKTGRKEFVGSTDNLHKWYRDLIKDFDKDEVDNQQELVRLTDSITNGLTDEKEKVKAIFAWVQGNIQYIAFEYELAGFIPRPASKVCSRRFGDCKDMASILKSMLDAAGIKAYLTWIGTRSIPFKYSEVPTPSVDNHMIATYIDKDGTPFFLDATDKYIPFGVPSDHIQGKEALVSFSETEYKVITVPVSPSSFTLMHDSCWIEVDGDKILGKGKMIYSGYLRDYVTYYITGSSKAQRLQYFRATLEKGSNKFKLQDFELKNLDNVYLPLEINYSFDIGDYVNTYENEMYVDMNLFKMIGTKIKEDRKLAFEYDFAQEHTEVITLKIPAGYKISYLPKDYQGTMKDFHYAVKYEVKGSELIYHLTLNRSVMMMDESYFKDWNKIFLDLTSALNESIVLIKE